MHVAHENIECYILENRQLVNFQVTCRMYHAIFHTQHAQMIMLPCHQLPVYGLLNSRCIFMWLGADMLMWMIFLYLKIFYTHFSTLESFCLLHNSKARCRHDCVNDILLSQNVYLHHHFSIHSGAYYELGFSTMYTQLGFALSTHLLTNASNNIYTVHVTRLISHLVLE